MQLRESWVGGETPGSSRDACWVENEDGRDGSRQRGGDTEREAHRKEVRKSGGPSAHSPNLIDPLGMEEEGAEKLGPGREWLWLMPLSWHLGKLSAVQGKPLHSACGLMT